jgi:hypothetical protein
MTARNPWITHRTRFVVKAKQFTASLAFTDNFGPQHSGHKGDYLVESSDGVLRVAPRPIFEDICVPLMSTPEETSNHPRTPTVSLPPHLTRKSPQPDRNRRSPSASVRSL